MNGLIAELKRRNVFRVGVAYMILGWVVMQVVDIVVPALFLPDWVPAFFLLTGIIGFPFVLLFAWAFELTPDGLMKTADVDESQSVAHSTARKLDFIVIGLLGLAVLFMLWDGYLAPAPTTAPEPEVAPLPAATASIAVLPFADMSPNKDQGYFADGISEELLNVLVRVDGLRVASRTSSFSYKGSGLDMREIAGELGVAHILEGSVRKAGNQVRITAQLIDTATDSHLWSETYDRELTDIFAIQDEIANAIVTALRDKLGVEEAPTIRVATVTHDMSAYDLFLKAHQLFITRTTLDESARLFEEVVALDPAFARAWEGLAAVYAVMPGWGFQDRDYIALSDQAVEKALALDDTLALAYATVASNMISRVDGDPNLIMDNYNKAIVLDPQNATLFMWRGLEYQNMGYIDASITDYEKCLALDPLYDNCRVGLAADYILKGEYAEGVAFYQQVGDRGFTGTNEVFVNAILQVEGRAAALLEANRYLEDEPAGAAWIAILADPDRDPARGLSIVAVSFEGSGYEMADSPGILIDFKAYEKVTASGPSDTYPIWEPRHTAFRRSPHFTRVIREYGYDKYWRRHGFPPQCRAVGMQDFACD